MDVDVIRNPKRNQERPWYWQARHKPIHGAIESQPYESCEEAYNDAERNKHVVKEIKEN